MKFCVLFLLTISHTLIFSQSPVWKSWQPLERTVDVRIATKKAAFYQLDFVALKKQLSTSPSELDRSMLPSEIQLPLPDGSLITFEVVFTRTLSPFLSARYPEIKNYLIKARGNSRIYGRIDVTYQGFHAMIQNGTELVFIDPALEGNTTNYLIYNKSDAVNSDKFSCLVEDPEHNEIIKGQHPAHRVSDNQIRTYRLAISCTGEYAQFHGGTKELTLSAMNTTVNRINFVYEHDFAVRFELIDKNDTLIYLDGSIDPYDNDDLGTQLDKNQEICDELIGTANYDIGHIFSTGGGGLAGYAVACSNDSKAIGGTGSGSPVNDPFDIDYVAHEIGHQMSGSHTQNNDCNRDESASFETGSASTIMGYAGICSPDVQSNSDAYFHGYNILEMGEYIVNGRGNDCPQKTDITGSKPVITGTSGDHTIPKLTPFELEASATSDLPLLYLWEQYDNEVAEIQPPVTTNRFGPLFRSYYADTSNIRTFPKIEYIVNNSTNPWESLAGVAREINFVVTVREDVIGGARHAQAFNALTVDANKGPFLVRSPNVSNTTWFSSESQTVAWDVAKTDQSPINCNRVKILLSEDGGYTYPHTIIETENDGSQEIQVPSVFGDKMRIKVASIGNVFFDISNNNFTIKDGLPPFSINLTLPSITMCANDSVSFYVRSESNDGIADTILLSAINSIPGLSIILSKDTLFSEDSVLVTVYTDDASAGIELFQLNFITAGHTIVKFVEINTINVPNAPTLFYPSNYSENVSTKVKFIWNAITGQSVNYVIEVATDKAFNNIIATVDEIVETTSGLITDLASNTLYYWRVKALGLCGSSTYSPTYLFRTEQCNQLFSSPFQTTPIDQLIVTDSIVVNDLTFEKVSDINVIAIRGMHSEVSELTLSLKNNENISAKLLDEPCSGEKILNIAFDDDSDILAIPCDDPEILGLANEAIRPVEPLSLFNQSNANNTYTLVINNSDIANNGIIEQWGLNICGATAVCAPLRIPDAIKTYKADRACKDNEGWTHYSISPENNPLGEYDLMIMSLKLNGDDVILPGEVSIRIPTTPLISKITTAQYINDPAVWAVLNRHWLLKPAIQPSGSTGIRFYFTDQEANALFTNAGINHNYDSLKVFSIYSNGILNPNPVSKHVGILPTDVKLHNVTYGDYNIRKYAEFYTTYLADGCIGAGGQFKAISGNAVPKSKIALEVFPNPANNVINIKYDDGNQLEYSLETLLGNQVLKGKMNNTNVASINTEHLNSGTYILRYKTKAGSGNTKIQVIK